MRAAVLGAMCVWFVQSVSGAAERDLQAQNWPHWRGPEATGLAPNADPPVEWDEQTNIKWKVAIPGLGNATPIVWENHIFVLTAVETGQGGVGKESNAAAESGPQRDADADSGEEDDARRSGRRRERSRGRGGRRRSPPPTNVYQFVVMDINRQTGETLWSHVAGEQVPHEGFRAGDNSFASGSPTTDGRRLYASFGSYGIVCYDFDGNQVWKSDLGDMQTRNAFGEGASPALYGNRLIVNWDHEGQSFIAGLDAESGKTIWKVDRDEPTSWTTPLVVDFGGRRQVVTSATNRVRSYDLETGELIWECGGQTVNAIPSPVRLNEMVICMSGFRGNAVYALPLSASGDLTGTDKVIWHYDGQTEYRPDTPYVPSPLLYDDLLYYLKSNNGILSCLSARTGEVHFDSQRLSGVGGVYASPVGAAGRIYIVGRDGSTAVVKSGRTFEHLATNRLDDHIDASPAVVGSEMFLRGSKHLYCVARN